MVQKIVENGQKFLDPFYVFLWDGSLIRADICVNQCPGSSACTVKVEMHSDDSLQRKAPNDAKNGQKMAQNGIFWTHCAFFSAMASWKRLIFMSITTQGPLIVV